MAPLARGRSFIDVFKVTSYYRFGESLTISWLPFKFYEAHFLIIFTSNLITDLEIVFTLPFGKLFPFSLQFQFKFDCLTNILHYIDALRGCHLCLRYEKYV